MAHKLGAIKMFEPASSKHTGTVIFLHGSGDTGHGVQEWVKLLLGKDIVFPHLRVIFPTAPLMPYTPLEGEPSNVWFDRLDISPDATEKLESIDSMAKEIGGLIQSETAAGIALNRIIIGGFSMGGAMAMHMGYRHMPQLAGVFALSSFLNRNSAVYEKLKAGPTPAAAPPMFMCHGEEDTLVPFEWGTETFTNLQKYGVQGQFVPLTHTHHELKKIELLKLYTWINKCVPEQQ